MNILDKFKSYCYNIKYGLSNIIYYIPAIFHDRKWDSYPIYDLLLYKLKRQEEYFRSDKAMTMDALTVADEIKLVKECLQRLNNNLYLHEMMDYFNYDELFGNTEYMTIDDTPNEHGLYPAHFTTNQDQQELFGKCSDLGDIWRETDKKFVFESIKNNIDEWWD